MELNIKKLMEETESWEYLANTHLPIVIYGTGNGADRVLDRFAELNICPLAVAVSKGFVRDRSFRGYKVIGIDTALTLFPDCVIALTFASPLESVIEAVKQLSKTNKLLMPSVPVYGNNIFDKTFLSSHSESIEKAYSLLADSQSRKVFKNIILFQITGDLKYVFDCESEKSEAYGILKLTPNEKYFDLGAYRGDTIDELLNYTGGYDKILALEPDNKTFKELSEKYKDSENIYTLNMGIWNSEKSLSIDKGLGRGSNITDLTGDMKVTTVDLLSKKYFTPTYINCDVEGAENQMLEGAVNTIKEIKPKLLISAYHRSEDIFELVNKVHNLNGDYSIYLRHHRHISFWDTNIICV